MAYQFQQILPDEHFVGSYIRYAAGHTDAPWEYHEALAFALLAAATPGVRARLHVYPAGLPTNLYVLLVGPPTAYRKSTCLDIAELLLDAALPGSRISEQFSPESFIEQLAERSRNTSVWVVDEFAEMLDKIHHATYMAGFRGLLLTVYSGKSYRYKRKSKRTSAGDKSPDEDFVEKPHLVIMGATTPEPIFRFTTYEDLSSGLWPRFAVIMPTGKPERRPLDETPEVQQREHNRLALQLHKIRSWAAEFGAIGFSDQALAHLDQYAAEIEGIEETDTPEVVKTMLQRLPAMAVKLAMLTAIGWPDATRNDMIVVSRRDAELAVQVARKWQGFMHAFALRIGETEFEAKLQRVKQVIVGCDIVARRTVARAVRLSAKELDEIEMTLADRGEITVTERKMDGKGRPSIVWIVHRDFCHGACDKNPGETQKMATGGQ